MPLSTTNITMMRLFALLAFLGPITVWASWTMRMPMVTTQRLDLIVFKNGSAAGHNHIFVGRSALLPGQDPEKFCVSSPIKDNRSAYWAPSLYFYSHKHGTFSALPFTHADVHYLHKAGQGEKIHTFPQGYMSIAGNSTQLLGPDPNKTKRLAHQFLCKNVIKGNKWTNNMPDGPCPDGITTQITFAPCWNGKDLDSEDHHSHVAYPLKSGQCPNSHPMRMMTVVLEMNYVSGHLAKKHAMDGFVLSTGDAKGYSLHADFVAHWKGNVLERAINECKGDIGTDLHLCPAFRKSLHTGANAIHHGPDRTNCWVKQSVQETVYAPDMKYLAGCNTVANGPFKGAGDGLCTKGDHVDIVPLKGGPDEHRLAVIRNAQKNHEPIGPWNMLQGGRTHHHQLHHTGGHSGSRDLHSTIMDFHEEQGEMKKRMIKVSSSSPDQVGDEEEE